MKRLIAVAAVVVAGAFATPASAGIGSGLGALAAAADQAAPATPVHYRGFYHCHRAAGRCWRGWRGRLVCERRPRGRCHF